ncbi:MAG TPA: hypothetical protein VJS88_00410 [Chthoniobacterales bacterium]|nr:hypothetical protein [Chthoniobacterales bacterium]
MADISITAASFVPSANATLVQGIAGGTLTRGMPVYYDSATGTYKQFDASNSSKYEFAGLACEDVASGQPLFVCTKDPALTLGGTVSVGDTIWGSATGVTKTIGDLTTGWRVWVLAVCTAASNIVNFNPVRGGVK